MPNDLQFEISATCKTNGQLVTTLTVDGEEKAVEKYAIGAGAARQRIAEKWSKAYKLDVSELVRELENKELKAQSAIERAELDDDGTDDDNKKSLATVIVSMIVKSKYADLFHDADGDAFGTVTIEDVVQTFPLRSRAFKTWVARLVYENLEIAVGDTTMASVLTVLEGHARFDGVERTTYTRIAGDDEAIHVDLGSDHWNEVTVKAGSWVTAACHRMKFTRAAAVEALPSPARGGTIELLRPFLNVRSDDDFILIVSWLVAALRPTGPYPVLVLNGEAGSAKSTACRILRALVDPNRAALRSEPREERDLVIAANNGWVLAFDNVSRLSPWLSDALCRIATGGGFATRTLYTDSDEQVFSSQRPILLNGIAEIATRGDLADRSIVVALEPIPDVERKTEAELWEDFDDARPLILGALLDAVSRAMGNVANVVLPGYPRMADFAKWSAAAAAAMGWTADEFNASYTGNRQAAVALTIESAAIGPALAALMADRPTWEGTASELLAELENWHCDERTTKRRDWPRTPRGMSEAVKRLAPALRRSGLDVSTRREPHTRRRLISIQTKGREVGAVPAPSVPSVPNRTDSSETPIQGDGMGTVGDGMGTVVIDRGTVGGRSGDGRRFDNRPPKNPYSSPESPIGDGGDGGDGSILPSLHEGQDHNGRPPDWSAEAWASVCETELPGCPATGTDGAGEP